MRNISQPQATCNWVQPTFEGQDISIGSPVQSEERCQTAGKAGIQMSQQILVQNELVRQGDVLNRYTCI